MRTEGLAAAAGLLASQIIKRDDEKRAFRQKLEEALFSNELKAGRVRATKAGEKSNASYGGVGVQTVTDEEIASNRMGQVKRANELLPPGVSGSYLPEVEGLKFHEKKDDRSSKSYDEALKTRMSKDWEFLPDEQKALVEHVIQGGDPKDFKYTDPASVKAAAAEAAAAAAKAATPATATGSGSNRYFGQGLSELLGISPSGGVPVRGGGTPKTADPILLKIQLLQSRGMADEDIANSLREYGIDPAQYGL